MTHLEKPLESLTAIDLMSTKLVTVREDMSLASAAKLLAEADVRGAPVVDSEGHCVGVISTTDFLRVAMNAKLDASARSRGAEFFCSWQIIDPQKLPAERVSHIMTRCPVTVPPDTPVGVLARMMVDSHVHRLVVVEDESGVVVGVVSATDLLDALANLPAHHELAAI